MSENSDPKTSIDFGALGFVEIVEIRTLDVHSQWNWQNGTKHEKE